MAGKMTCLWVGSPSRTAFFVLFLSIFYTCQSFAARHDSNSPLAPGYERQDHPSTLEACLDQTKATILYPGSNGYNTTAQSQNTNYHYRPKAITRPGSTEEVAAIVRCVAAERARGGSSRLSSYSGGHGYASYALGGANGFVIIESGNLKDLQLESASKTVTVGMGMTVGPLSLAIGEQGFALPHGTCNSIGVAGHSMGGGWGFTSRRWGWMLDHIVGVTYVDPQGSVQNISETSSGPAADIWWAIRGAGANNFGVVTAFTFAVVNAPARAVNYKTTFPTNDACAMALVGLQELGLKKASDGGLPAELGAQLLLYGEGTSDEGACAFSGQYLGPLQDFRQVEKTIIADFRSRTVPMQPANATEFDNWVETLTNLMGPLTAPRESVPYYAQSLVDDGAPGYARESALAIVAAVQRTVNVSNSSTSLSFDLNGPVARTNGRQPNGDSSSAAAGMRKALFISQIYNYGFPGPDQPQAQSKTYAAVDGVTDAVRAAKPGGAWRAYVNYVDPRLANFGHMYYGGGLSRLKSIKAKADPDLVFDYPQGLAHA